MRKNTLIKLLAVLVMCLTIGAAFVACSEEPATTPANDDVKVIISVAVDANNNLVIAYNDNTTTTVALPKEAECEHRDGSQAWWPLAEHTATSNGTYLKVCHDCQDAWIIYDIRHQFVDKELVKEATCTEAGYVADRYCEICNHIEHIAREDEATGHKYGEVIVTPNDGESVCVSGGTQYHKCSVCGYEEDLDDIAPAKDDYLDGQHTVTVWVDVVKPTTTSEGTVEGKCDVCGVKVTKNVPALNENDYTKVITKKALACGDEGEDTYTHNYTKLQYVVVRAPHDHGLMGLDKNFHELASAIVNDPVNSKKHSTADFPQIQEFVADSIKSCSTPTLAYYVCEHINDEGKPCGGVVDIYAITGHEFTIELTDEYEAPKCGVEGKKWFKCYDCDEKDYEVVAALEHVFEYDCDEYTDLTIAADKKSATYVGTCKYGCGTTDKKTTKAFSVVAVSKTCERDATNEYAWTTHDGKEVTDTEIVDTKKGHAIKVNGVVITLEKADEKKPDSAIVYYYADFVDAEGNPLLFNFVDDEFSAEPSIGYFECCHTDLHKGGATLVKVWVSTDPQYAENTPDELK